MAIKRLEEMGFSVIDMNQISKTAPFDLLLEGKYRNDVKASVVNSYNNYKFQLTNKVEGQCKHRKIGNRTKKNYEKACDFFLFIGLEDEVFYLVPSHEIAKEIITVNIGRRNSTKKEHKIKSRQDVLTAITKFDTSMIAQHPAVEKSEHMRTEEIVFENERKVINLIRGAIKTRGLSATYSISNEEKMDARIGYTSGIKKYSIDLTDPYSVETFQLDLQKEIKLEDAQ